MPQVYEGDRPYIFVNYSHADDAVVLPIIDALMVAGYRVWFDKGIQVATEFPDYIADHIYGCACFIMFVSRASLASDWCKREVNYALYLRKRIVPIYLEDVELTRGLQLSIGALQATLWYRFRSDETFLKMLFKTPALDVCLTDEGRRSRGVKPRNDNRSGLPDVARKGSLADYSWVELKVLSQIIAAAGDGDWLGVAKEYNLVDANGKLSSDTKPFRLTNGTNTGIRILGFRHDELAAGGKAGISFEFADVPTVHHMNVGWTNAGGWEKSEMREWLKRDFFTLLPEDLRSCVVPVRKMTNNTGHTESLDDVSVVTRTDDKLWLLSVPEVYGKTYPVFDAEGKQYQLYADKGVSTTNYDFCKKSGASSWWWLRSPSAGSSNRFCCVLRDGGWIVWNVAVFEGGVSPGFCF